MEWGVFKFRKFVSGLSIFVWLLEHEWASNLELERFSEVKHKGKSKLCKALLQKSQLFPEISAHQLGAASSVCHGDGHYFFVVLSVLNAKYWTKYDPPPPPSPCKCNCWNMTGLLLCKHGTSLFGCPCWSHAHLKPCELRVRILIFSVGLLDLCLMLVVELTTLAES